MTAGEFIARLAIAWAIVTIPAWAWFWCATRGGRS